MTKQQTYDILRGSNSIDVNKYLDNQYRDLNQLEKKFSTPTAIDQKFFQAKLQELRQKEQLIYDCLEQVGIGDTPLRNCEITLTIEKKDNLDNG